MKRIMTCFAVLFSIGTLCATTYYASPTGGGNGSSYSSPTTFSLGLGKLHNAGDTLYLLSGVYYLSTTDVNNKVGTADKRIVISGYEGTNSAGSYDAILDFRETAYGERGLQIKSTCSYVHVKNLTLRYSGKNNLINQGHHNLFENLDIYGSADTGCQMKGKEAGGEDGGNNIIKNVDSHDNFDYKLGGTTASDFGGNADGFADKQFTGAGNHYIGCRAWNNSDDGWDFFERISTSQTIIENCICYANGPADYNMNGHARYETDKAWFEQFKDGLDVKDADGNPVHVTMSEYTNMGNGNGFKLGGKNTEHNVIVHHCLSVNNTVKGYDQNNDAGTIYLYNNTAYHNNPDYGFSNNNGCQLHVQNCISYSSQSENKLTIAVTNNHNSWNGFSVSSSDFQSRDKSLILAPRNADGSLPENDFMRLTDESPLIDAGVNVGYSYKGNAPDLGCYESSNDKPQTAILNWKMGVNGTDATVANSIKGAAGCAAEGFTITITGNTGKSWNAGNGSIKYNTVAYTTLKNSNGAQNTVTLPAGKYAHKIDFYATSNPRDEQVTQQGKLTEFNGVTCNDVVESVKDYTNPTHISKTLETPANQFTFTFKEQQVCFIAVITYTSSDPATSFDRIEPSYDKSKHTKILRDGQLFIRREDQLYTPTGQRVQ